VKNISRYLKKRNHSLGLPPGSLVHVGRKRTDPIRISVFDYDEFFVEEKELEHIEDCFSYRDTNTITWINIDGIYDAHLIEKIGSHFSIHPLILEDVMNTGQRPKIESFENYLYIVLKMLYHDKLNNKIESEQISIILLKNLVISFQEKPGDIFNTIRERIRTGKGRIRKAGADYLAYVLLDTIVDHYFIIMESIGEKIEEIDENLIDHSSPETLHQIHRLKADMIFLKKSIWPLRELISSLLREDTELITNTINIYLRDVYDHCIQVMDAIDSYRDIISGLIEIYMSNMSNKMNEVMKVLTIFASIFIPLTFIAGIYGMNFNPNISPFNMPELNWFWGYPFVLIIMLSMATIMLFYFKRKNWI